MIKKNVADTRSRLPSGSSGSSGSSSTSTPANGSSANGAPRTLASGCMMVMAILASVLFVS